ncbi:hypothetical protein ACFS07_22635 [Undibacterium arcticum]
MLDKVQLSEAVSEALLTRGGMYGPYLALAEACELNSSLIGSLAAPLDISPSDVNKAHLAALAWSQKHRGLIYRCDEGVSHPGHYWPSGWRSCWQIDIHVANEGIRWRRERLQ